MTTSQRAHEYAQYLRGLGHGIADVRVFRYQSLANGYPETDRRSVRAHGYAVRYTAPGGTPTIVVFTGNGGLPFDRLTAGGIIADIAGEPVTAYWVAAYRRAIDDADEQVILKAFTPHEAGASYSWQLTPRQYFHVIMEPEEASQ